MLWKNHVNLWLPGNRVIPEWKEILFSQGTSCLHDPVYGLSETTKLEIKNAVQAIEDMKLARELMAKELEESLTPSKRLRSASRFGELSLGALKPTRSRSSTSVTPCLKVPRNRSISMTPSTLKGESESIEANTIGVMEKGKKKLLHTVLYIP